jgi:hypothetical protein
LRSFFAVPASAATFRIDVVGQFQSVTLLSPSVYDAAIDSFSPVPQVPYAPGDDVVDQFWFAAWAREDDGSALFDTGRFSGCSGILNPLCFGMGTAGPNGAVSSNGSPLA